MVEKEQKELEEGLPEEKQEPRKDLGFLDSKYPLWQAFREKAGGTHKHTQSLESMVDNVQAAAGMDSVNLRVATRFHDVGKLLSPEIFSENQGKDNVHDGLAPWVSYQLITRHVSDSIMLMVANDFPREVIKIVSQHHGNCLVQAAFERAKEENSDVDDEIFRYQTEKPKSLEALILMLCDQVEATSRSLFVSQKKEADPAVFVANIYHKLHLDGQFDEVQVLLGNLKRIQAALISDVASSFQKRVQYKEDTELVKAQ